MKLSRAEQQLLRGLSCVIGQALPLDYFTPATRTMIKRMRKKGVLSKRQPAFVRMTQLGKSLP